MLLSIRVFWKYCVTIAHDLATNLAGLYFSHKFCASSFWIMLKIEIHCSSITQLANFRFFFKSNKHILNQEKYLMKYFLCLVWFSVNFVYLTHFLILYDLKKKISRLLWYYQIKYYNFFPIIFVNDNIFEYVIRPDKNAIILCQFVGVFLYKKYTIGWWHLKLTVCYVLWQYVKFRR